MQVRQHYSCCIPRKRDKSSMAAITSRRSYGGFPPKEFMISYGLFLPIFASKWPTNDPQRSTKDPRVLCKASAMPSNLKNRPRVSGYWTRAPQSLSMDAKSVVVWSPITWCYQFTPSGGLSQSITIMIVWVSIVSIGLCNYGSSRGILSKTNFVLRQLGSCASAPV